MSLVGALTPERLQHLADWGYERGVRYFEEGRVASWRVDGEVLDGVVFGSGEYRVRLFANAGGLGHECTCPVGDRGQACKHVVALGLAFLAGAKPAPRAHTDVFATRDELQAWASEHDVEHELSLGADVLLAELGGDAGARWVLGRLTLAQVGSLDGAQRYLGARRLAEAVAEAARKRLVAAAQNVAAGIAAEATRPTPEGPAGEMLASLRAHVRADAAPRASAPGVLAVDHTTGTAFWTETARLAGGAVLEAQLQLVPRPTIRCSCKREACTHMLALIDRVCEELTAYAGELMRPPWQRALAELAAVAAPRARIEVWWQIEDSGGSPTIVPIVRKEKKRGGTTAGARIAPDRLLAQHVAEMSDQDVRICEHLAAHRYTIGSSPARAFAALVAHPRVMLDGETIAVRRVPLAFVAHPAGNDLRLEPSVAGARFSPRLLAPLLELYAPGEPLIVIEPEHARCLLVDVTAEARKLWSVLDKHGDTFPPESHGPLLERIAALDGKVPVDVPESIKGAQLDAELVTVVRVRLVGATLELEMFVRPAPGAPLFAPGAGPRDVLLLRDGRRGYVKRALTDELALARGALARLPLETAEEGPPGCFRLEGDAALDLVQALAAPPPGIEAEWVDARPTILSSPAPNHLRVQIDRKRDWFEMGGDLKLDHARIELAVVLDAMRRQQRFVRVDEHRWVELSDKLRERLQPLSDATFHGKHGLEISPAAAGALDGLEVKATPTWRELCDRLAAAKRLRPKPPASLVGTLRPYQKEGHAWLSRLAAWGSGACLADDMGLGKTVQAIALLLDRAKHGPALVLAPTSVTLNWVDELRRFAPDLTPVVYADDRGALDKLGPRDVLIASYGLLVRDAARLAGTRFATIVLDEAQALKNASTQRAKAARALDGEFRLAMSGTPLENHVGELWSLFSIVFPGLLGSWEQFRERFAIPIDRDRDPDARAALSRLIRPFLLRRTKGEVARELPARTEIEVPVALSDDEAQLYEDARLAAVAHLAQETKKLRDEQRRFQVLAALTRLRLLASHPKLYDPSSPVASSKMARLLELCEELRDEGHRALVFSQFTSHLALVKAELDRAKIRYLYLDGATPMRTRAQLVERFQNGEADVFLISLKAGGTGINLTAADYVIHLDPWWNPAVEDQATDRAHRIGQTRPVTVYRLISRGTVEERILALHAEKRALVMGLLEGTDVAARLSTRDLLALIGSRLAPTP
jgi:superfamily II DNA or RNA helicase